MYKKSFCLYRWHIQRHFLVNKIISLLWNLTTRETLSAIFFSIKCARSGTEAICKNQKNKLVAVELHICYITEKPWMPSARDSGPHLSNMFGLRGTSQKNASERGTKTNRRLLGLRRKQRAPETIKSLLAIIRKCCLTQICVLLRLL